MQSIYNREKEILTEGGEKNWQFKIFHTNILPIFMMNKLYHGERRFTRTKKGGENMLSIDAQKEREINKMVIILQQIDTSDIELLSRDADTLLMRKKRVEMESNSLPNRVAR